MRWNDTVDAAVLRDENCMKLRKSGCEGKYLVAKFSVLAVIS